MNIEANTKREKLKYLKHNLYLKDTTNALKWLETKHKYNARVQMSFKFTYVSGILCVNNKTGCSVIR